MSETARSYAVGDKVTPNPNYPGLPAATHGRVFTVAKINPKNIRASADDGGRGINFPPEGLLPATEVGRGAEAVPFVPQEHFPSGSVVTLKRAYREWGTNLPMVVLADKGNKVNVAPLGGSDEDRYLRVPPAGLERRDAEWLAERLLEEATT